MITFHECFLRKFKIKVMNKIYKSMNKKKTKAVLIFGGVFSGGTLNTPWLIVNQKMVE